MAVSRWRLVALQVAVGTVCGVGAAGLVHGSPHGSHLKHGWLLLAIAILEIVAVALFWIPGLTRIGAHMLIAVLVIAAAFHVAVGEGFPYPLVVYAFSVGVVASASELAEANQEKDNE